MANKNKYWKGTDELLVEGKEENSFSHNEFKEDIPVRDFLQNLNVSSGRRKFLKAMGFGLGAATIASCTKTPVRKVVPYLVKPEDVVPGVPNYYASSWEGMGVVVKTQVGRPIKIDGNPSCLVSGGGLSSKGQASLLGLYDLSRAKEPRLGTSKVSWRELDEQVAKAADEAQSNGKGIRVLSSPITSASSIALIDKFLAKYSNAKHVAFRPQSTSGIVGANEKSFGKAVVPKYNFDKANLIISFGADFLGSWLSPVEFSKQYVENRSNSSLEKGKMSRHIQFESGLSLTGTNADCRVTLKQSLYGLALLALREKLKGAEGDACAKLKESNPNAYKMLSLVQKEFEANIGKVLVISDSNSEDVQLVVNDINNIGQAYGNTIDLDRPFMDACSDKGIEELESEMNKGEVDFLCVIDANPVYNYSASFADALKKVKFSVALSLYEDETAKLSSALAPMSHYLEAWGDNQQYKDYHTIVQPVINKVYNTRSVSENFNSWMGSGAVSDYDYVKGYWEKSVLPGSGMSFDQMLQKGCVDAWKGSKSANKYSDASVQNAVSSIFGKSKEVSDKTELNLYFSVAMGDGKYANNPMLQEVPDPVSKVVWDNYVAINPAYAKKLGIEEFEKVTLSNGEYEITLPAIYQPGQTQGTVSVALGYGRKDSGKVGTGVGQDAYPFVRKEDGNLNFTNTVDLKPSGEKRVLAQTQTHHTIEGRDIVRETSLSAFVENPKKASKTDKPKMNMYDLWDAYPQPDQRWVMAIDLNACTGCGACIVACNTENNVPVVGRQEVRNRREMHWIRIDRYYSFKSEDGEDVTEEREMYKVEDYENVSVVHQPMLCQQCDHAPCETVCPVAATTHSAEGLNHMTYNRCVGTRYCANNCPYKVRRFNWFNYWNDEKFDNYLNNEFAHLALNPDVTTRFRGVMEKCSFCIQRIQKGKLDAKKEARRVVDGDIKMACQQTCPTNAIIFGDAHDEKSEVYKLINSDRTYYVLEELNIQPKIGYMTKVRNGC